MPSNDIGYGRQIQYRVIIQKKNGSKYYPQLVDCTTNDQYPFTCPTATVELAASTIVARQHLSPIRCDDIIRVQWSEKTQTDQKTVWRDMFSGRIMTPSAQDSANNNASFVCRGHAEEAVYSALKSDYSASSTTTGAILRSIINARLNRITDVPEDSWIDVLDSTLITSYNVKSKTKYLTDIIRELELLENKNYRFRTLPVYNNDGNLSSVRPVWEKLPTVANSKVKAISGTDRYLSSWFQDSIDQLVNDVTIFGESGSPQKEGTSTNSESQASYDTRDHIDTDLSLGSDALCETLASAIDNEYNQPVRSGQVLLQLSPDLLPGDLLYCKVPKIHLNGSAIDDDCRVVRVSHRTSTSQTTADVGRITQYPYDILESFSARLRLGNANLID